MAFYGVFCLYVCFLVPRISADEIYERVARQEEVPMLVMRVPMIALQTVPMLVAVLVYYRKFAPWGLCLAVPFVYNLLLTLSSGARREAVWSLLALLSAFIARRKISPSLAYAVSGAAALAVIAGTVIRMNSDDVSMTNLAGQDLQSVSNNVHIATSGGKDLGGDLYHTVVVDAVYHFADAHHGLPFEKQRPSAAAGSGDRRHGALGVAQLRCVPTGIKTRSCTSSIISGLTRNLPSTAAGAPTGNRRSRSGVMPISAGWASPFTRWSWDSFSASGTRRRFFRDALARRVGSFTCRSCNSSGSRTIAGRDSSRTSVSSPSWSCSECGVRRSGRSNRF